MASREGEEGAGRKRDAEAAVLDVSPPQAKPVVEGESEGLEEEEGATVSSDHSSNVASHSPLVAPLDTLVPAPELGRRMFVSWEEFHSYLQEYSQETHQLYSVRSATPSSRRNSLMTTKRPGQSHQLIPERFAHYVKTITCTHGGKPRHRSTGARPNHHHRAIHCPAQINACVKKDGPTWQIHITNQNAWHNHEVSETLYRSYPEVRNALGAEVLATVNILRKAEAKRKKILEYIIENTSQTPKMKDVHNLLSKMKRNEKTSS
ncbi:hypothetical protein BBJ28_00009200 [Nothophytophthora sp. Chile5]|nr:hypothetical protein BBJ28_00009200 [Nothophytophthora sp. Chile5]